MANMAIERVKIGRSVWYWNRDKRMVYRCQYAAQGEAMAARGEERDVVEYKGGYFVKYGRGYIRIA